LIEYEIAKKGIILNEDSIKSIHDDVWKKIVDELRKKRYPAFIVITNKIVDEYSGKLHVDRKRIRYNLNKLKRRLNGKYYGIDIVPEKWIYTKIKPLTIRKKKTLEKARNELKDETDVQIIALALLDIIDKAFSTDSKLCDFLNLNTNKKAIHTKKPSIDIILGE